MKGNVWFDVLPVTMKILFLSHVRVAIILVLLALPHPCVSLAFLVILTLSPNLVNIALEFGSVMKLQIDVSYAVLQLRIVRSAFLRQSVVSA